MTSPIAAKAEEHYNVKKKEEATADTGRIYYLKNSHGDVIGQMDENGNLLTSYAYSAFGEQISAVAIFGEQKSTTNRFLYAGEQYDETSGLYYLRARHYDVRAGRFTQEDTYLGDGRNLYAYVHSNPLKYVDPTGHDSVEIFDPDGNPLDDWQDKSIDGGGGSVHGNSLSYPGTNYGYALVDRSTSEILKFGETIHPDTRYTQSYLNNNAVMKVLDYGSKADIHMWQYDMNNYYKNQYGEYPTLNSKGW